MPCIDGEAMLLGVDGLSDFDGLHSRTHDDEAMLKLRKERFTLILDHVCFRNENCPADVRVKSIGRA